MWLACFATVEIEIGSQGNLPKTNVQSGYTASVPVSGGVIPHSWLVSTQSCSNLKKRANTGCGDLTRPLATPNSARVGSPVPICLLPLCPDLAASLRRLAELSVSLLVTITQLSELYPKPNSQIIPIPSLLQPAQLETFSHRMSWDLLSSRNCNQLCESFHSFLLHLFNLAV